MPSRPSNRGHLSDSLRRDLNEIIRKDAKQRERPVKDRFDAVLMTNLVTKCTEHSIDINDVEYVMRRYLTLTHDMSLEKIHDLFVSVDLPVLNVKEMSA